MCFVVPKNPMLMKNKNLIVLNKFIRMEDGLLGNLGIGRVVTGSEL
jgi:hypothetical protein